MTDTGFSIKSDLVVNASDCLRADDLVVNHLHRGYFDRLILRGKPHELVSEEVVSLVHLAEERGLTIEAICPFDSPLGRFADERRVRLTLS